jgi:cyclase
MGNINAFRKIVLGLVVAVLSAGMAMAQTSTRLTRLNDRIYAYLGTGGDTPACSFGANTGFVVGDNGVLVIDTLTSAAQAKKFLEAIRTVTDKPIRWVVNTHYHLDHSFGNCVFAQAGGVIIAQEKASAMTEPYMTGVMANLSVLNLTPQDLEGTVMTPPSITFADQLTINVGGTTVQVVSLGTTHTPDSVCVFFPAEKIMFVGDMLFTGYHPNLRDGDIDNWSKMLDRLAAMNYDKIIPGHGPLSTAKDLADMKTYMLTFNAQAKAIVASWPDKTDIAGMAAKLKPLLPVRERFEFAIAYNLQKYAQKAK